MKGQSPETGATTETERERKESSDLDPDDHEFEEDEAIYMNISRTPLTSESSSKASSSKATKEEETVDDDGPIEVQVKETAEKGAHSRGVEKKGTVISTSAVTPPHNLGLMSLVGGPGLKKGS